MYIHAARWPHFPLPQHHCSMPFICVEAIDEILLLKESVIDLLCLLGK